MLRLSLATATLLAFTAFGATTHAEIIGTDPGTQDNSMPTSSTGVAITGWNNVGKVSGSGGTSSAIYLGNGWVLTANHVGVSSSSTYQYGNTTYSLASPYTYHELSTPSTFNGTSGDAGADLGLFKINTSPGGLPAPVTLASSDVASGEELYSVGNGFTRTSNESLTDYYVYSTDGGTTEIWSTTPVAQQTTPNAAGYAESGGGFEMWGNNHITPFNATTGAFGSGSVINSFTTSGGTVQGFVSEFYTQSTVKVGGDTEEVEVAPFDSGGGVFNDAGQLIGMNDASLGFLDQPVNTAVLGNGSEYADLYQYENQIEFYTLVPEPVSAAFAVFGFAAIALRRRSMK